MELPNSHHHHQAMAGHHHNQQLEEVLQVCPNSNPQQQQQEKKARPQPEQALKCPRCASTNTKFCYYNNYSLTQPRYFCKGCRRYWTQGGSLRNVPVGGGCRRNKRSSNPNSSSSSSLTNYSSSPSTAKVKAQTSNNPLLLPSLLPSPIGYDPNDLTLAFAATLHKQQPPHDQASSKQLGFVHDSMFLGHSSSTHDQNVPTGGSFLDILRSGFVDTRNCTSGLNNYYYGFSSAAAAAANGGLEVGNVMSTGDHQAAGVLSSEGGGGGSCKDMDHEGDDSTKVLMGFPWQVQQQAAGDHHHHGSAGMSAVEFAGRDYWAAAAGVAANSSWHGLINNPLM